MQVPCSDGYAKSNPAYSVGGKFGENSQPKIWVRSGSYSRLSRLQLILMSARQNAFQCIARRRVLSREVLQKNALKRSGEIKGRNHVCA